MLEFPSTFEPDFFTAYMFIESIVSTTVDLQFIENIVLTLRSKTLRMKNLQKLNARWKITQSYYLKLYNLRLRKDVRHVMQFQEKKFKEYHRKKREVFV